MALESGSSMCAFGQGDTEWFLDVLGCVQERRTGLFLSGIINMLDGRDTAPERVENDSVKNEEQVVCNI